MPTLDGKPQCLEVPRFTFDHAGILPGGAQLFCQMEAGHTEPLHADLYIAKDGTRTEVRWRRLP